MLQPRYISGPVFNVECFPIYLVDINLENGSSLVPGWNVNLAQDKEKRHKCLLMRDGLSLLEGVLVFFPVEFCKFWT